MCFHKHAQASASGCQDTLNANAIWCARKRVIALRGIWVQPGLTKGLAGIVLKGLLRCDTASTLLQLLPTSFVSAAAHGVVNLVSDFREDAMTCCTFIRLAKLLLLTHTLHKLPHICLCALGILWYTCCIDLQPTAVIKVTPECYCTCLATPPLPVASGHRLVVHVTITIHGGNMSMVAVPELRQYCRYQQSHRLQKTPAPATWSWLHVLMFAQAIPAIVR